ncbi:hypothetical protein PIROE2DRAFT_3732 [Piromyces sp. E2]|nr:hypothetical protein PIROE2DRAFT_3732 [Piromyces sp. E2]|eukprot:OUM68585.1 hypothetical protein PIROE2DRAFT_3732 [Piromyces sp. E2]
MHYKNPYLNEWKVKGRPGFLEIFSCVLKRDNRIDDYDFFQKLFINFNFQYPLSNEAIQSLLNILEHTDNTVIIKIVIELLHKYILSDERCKKKIFDCGIIDACIFRLINKNNDSFLIELFELIKDVNIPSELTKLQCLIFSRIFETCFDIYRNDSIIINKVFECFNTFLQSEYSIYPLLKFLNPLLKNVSAETVTHVLNSINSMIKFNLAKTPIIKYLLHQILNKNFDVTKASYNLLLRISNNVNDFIKEWGSMHVSTVMKNKNIDLLFPVALLVKKLLMKGKLHKKNDNVNSNSILKKFQTMREEKRKESGNETEYNIVAKKLENKISEFHPVVYTLDNLEAPVDLPISPNETYEDEDDETELLEPEKKPSKEAFQEVVVEEKKVDIIAMMELKRKEEEERERERENQRVKRKENMLKKYDIDKNGPQIDYTTLDNINIDDEYNKINRYDSTNNTDIIKENKTLDEKMYDICKKIINKRNNKATIINSKIDENKNKDVDTFKNNINEIPDNVNPEDYHKNVNKFNKFVNANVRKKTDKKNYLENKNNYFDSNDDNDDDDTKPEKVKSMYEKEKKKLCSKSEMFPNFSNDHVDDFIVDSDSCIFTPNESGLIDVDVDYLNDDAINIDVINQSDKNLNQKIQKDETYVFKSLKTNETVENLVNKIQKVLKKIKMNKEDYQNIEKFLKEEEFITNEMKEDDDVGYVIHKEILYDLYNDLKTVKTAYVKDEDIKKIINDIFGDTLNNVDFLEVYKSKLINSLYNSDFTTNLEYIYLEYLIKEKNKNKEYQANRSTILDLFEDDNDIDDDLFNKCISTLKYQALKSANVDNNKHKIEKKKEQLRFLRKNATERKIKNIKNKRKKIYEEYQKGISKRHPQKGKNKKSEQFMDKFFSDISLNKDIRPIEDMTEDFLYQKVKEYGSNIFKSQSLTSSRELSTHESNVEIISTPNKSIQSFQDNKIDNDIISALEKFSSYNDKIDNIDFIMISILNELKNSKYFHEKINELINFINNNDNKSVIRN